MSRSAQQAARHSLAASQDGQGRSPGDTLQRRLLLIDDSEFDRLRLSRELSRAPFPVSVRTAIDIVSAQGLLTHESFDTIFVDYRLPIGTGIDLIDWLAETDGPNAGTPCILITGEDDETLRDMAHRRGCGFLTKHHLTPQRLALSILASGQQGDGKDPNTGQSS